jgi:hypothetical protein
MLALEPANQRHVAVSLAVEVAQSIPRIRIFVSEPVRPPALARRASVVWPEDHIGVHVDEREQSGDLTPQLMDEIKAFGQAD